MEPISFVASLVTLVEVAGVAAKSARRVCSSFRNAPQELASMEEDLFFMHIGLTSLLRLHTEDTHSAIDEHTRQKVYTTLRSAEKTFGELEATCDELNNRQSRRSRIHWALLGQSSMQKHLEQLRTLQTKFRCLFQTISFQKQNTMSSDIVFVKEVVTSISEKLGLTQAESRSTPRDLGKERIPDAHIRNKSRRILVRKAADSTWLWWSLFQFSLLGIEIDSAASRTAEYSLTFQLPILLGRWAVAGSLRLRTCQYSSSLSIIAPSTLSVGRVVAEDSAAMAACSGGRLSVLKQQLLLGQATLYDITKQNWNFMKLAVEGGNLELIQFLLDNGLNANSTFGKSQTSALQWALQENKFDVAQLLIDNGADVNHISLLGWTPLFYCWPRPNNNQDVRLREIELLSSIDELDLDIIDRRGWTLLQRLAAFGTREEVRKVIALGADLMVFQEPLTWLPIWHATYHGNLSTFLELLEHYPSSIIRETDKRGWTLLHIAASEGHGDIIRHLLSLDSDPWALSNPFFSHVLPSLCGQRCTPADAAAAESPQCLKLYDSILEELGICERRRSEEDGVDDMFWEACETFA